MVACAGLTMPSFTESGTITMSTISDPTITGADNTTLKRLTDNVVTIDAYADFPTAISAIGSTNQTTLVINKSVTVASNTTVTSNITLWFLGAGQLSPNAGVTITLNGPVQAPLTKIFAGGGTVTMGRLVPTVYPQWWGAVADGVTDDAVAINAAVAATPSAGHVHFPPTSNYYRVLSTVTVNKSMHISGEGWRYGGGSPLVGSVIRQEGGVTNDALVIDGTAQELNGFLVENLVLGGTANSRYAFYLKGTLGVNRSVFRNILLAGAGTTGMKMDGLLILNTFDHVSISMGFTSPLGYAVPTIGFDLGPSTGPNTFINCGVAGVTAAPGYGLYINSTTPNVFLSPEAEGNTVGWQFAVEAWGNMFYTPYHEANTVIIGGTTTSPTNISVGSNAGASLSMGLGAAGIGVDLEGATYTGNVSAFRVLPTLLAGNILSTYTRPQGTLHVSRTNVTTPWDGTVEGGVPLFVHTDTNTAGVAVAQFLLSGTLASGILTIGASGGKIGLQSTQRNSGAQTPLQLNQAGGGIQISSTTLALLPAQVNGVLYSCTDCKGPQDAGYAAGSCSGGGTGRLVQRWNSTWIC
jgi:hypothetical protein